MGQQVSPERFVAVIDLKFNVLLSSRISPIYRLVMRDLGTWRGDRSGSQSLEELLGDWCSLACEGSPLGGVPNLEAARYDPVLGSRQGPRGCRGVVELKGQNGNRVGEVGLGVVVSELVVSRAAAAGGQKETRTRHQEVPARLL